jgi:hypothetical protein
LDKTKKENPPANAPKYKSFSDRFGDGKFHEDLPKKAWKECIDKTFILSDAKILVDFHSEDYGVHDAALMCLAPVEKPDEKFTTICSGGVVVKRIKEALEKRYLPMVATPVYPDEKYYNIL